MLLQGKRIFIIEDNIHNRVVFTMALNPHGASLHFDRWGRDPEWRIQALKDVDLIILDLMLWRGTSGYDIFDEIRSLPEYDAVPIVAVSAAEPFVALPLTKRKGFAGFIAKPIDQELFPEQLALILGGEHVWYAGERYER